jgi:FtsZ-binding cell division protein ZapB
LKLLTYFVDNQRLFEASDSLEAAVASERINALKIKTEKLIHQRTYLRDERRRLRIQTEQIEERKRALKTAQRGDWVPDVLKEPEEEHKLINISGLMFEAPVSVLRRDKDSLLAQLCSAEPPMLPDPDGFFLFRSRLVVVSLYIKFSSRRKFTR